MVNLVLLSCVCLVGDCYSDGVKQDEDRQSSLFLVSNTVNVKLNDLCTLLSHKENAGNTGAAVAQVVASFYLTPSVCSAPNKQVVTCEEVLDTSAWKYVNGGIQTCKEI